MHIMRRLLYLMFGLFLCVSAMAQGIITGHVTSQSDNKPISGVSVTVKGSTRSTQTDESGNFSINASPGQVLQFSSVGFATMEVKVGNSATLNATLASQDSQMGEVVVTA